MLAKRYRTVAAEIRHEGEKVKGSRFIVTVAPLPAVDAVAPLIARLRAELPTANHHCYAYRMQADRDIFRYSDGGEPSGTAGRPILQQIDGRKLTDTVIVVSRIFGGTKLGVGGLIRAYGGAAREALDHTQIREVIPVRSVTIEFPYELQGTVQGVLQSTGLIPVESRYGESVTMRLDIPEGEADAFLAELTERTAGRVSLG